MAAVAGIAPDVIARGLSSAPPVAGRFETVDAGQPFTVVVDYSHKPDALDQALRTARELVSGEGELAVVFGCGGDRHCQAAAHGRGGGPAGRPGGPDLRRPAPESPDAIIAAIAEGIPPGTALVTEPDRRRAIEAAVAAARPGGVVVVAGKGHETTQVVGPRAVPFDDRVVAREALERLGAARSNGNHDRPGKGALAVVPLLIAGPSASPRPCSAPGT